MGTLCGLHYISTSDFQSALLNPSGTYISLEAVLMHDSADVERGW